MTSATPWLDGQPGVIRHRALARFLAAQRPLYALLDAARDPSILGLLQASDCRHDNLFTDERAASLAAFAPHLVSLTPGAALCDELIPHWGAHWGIYLTAEGSYADLLAHLRELLWPDTPDGPMLWRFYDPRVLRELLPSCDARRAAAFFGPVRAFLCAGRDSGVLLHCTRDADGVVIDARPISALAPG